MKKYPLAKPCLGQLEKKQVLQVLNSGRLSLGPVYREFEKKFAKKIGVKYACAVSSGTAGLHLALLAAKIKSGDEVITTPFSFVASANCIMYVGAKPVFVDIDPITYNLDPLKIEAKITKRTKAILVVHIFGQAAAMTPIIKLAKKYRLKIIEDACESILATYHGRLTGTFGESAVFAFYPNKQMTTGEGGMVLTNNQKLFKLCSSLRNQGRADNLQWLDHQYLGYNYRLGEINAALGLAQLKKLDSFVKTRQKIAAWYTKHLKPFDQLIQPPLTALQNRHSWFVYVIRLKQKTNQRNKIIKILARQGIQTKPYLPCIHLFDFYRKNFGYKKGDFPVAEKISQSSLALPFYIGLTEKDIKIIVNQLIKTLTNL